MAEPTSYRDLVRPSMLETGISDDSGAAALSSLADSFKAFEQVSTDVGTTLRSRAGALAGAKEGAAGNPAFRRGIRAYGAFGRAYNNSAEVAYSNKLQLDIDAALDKIELESEADPVAYEARARGHLDGVLKELPGEVRPLVEQRAQARMQAGTARVAVQAQALARSEAEASYIESEPARIMSAVKAMQDLPPEQADEEMAAVLADNDAQLEALVADKVMSPAQAAVARQRFISNFEAAIDGTKISMEVEDLMGQARINTETADQALAMLEDRTDLTADQKNEIRTAYREQMNLYHFERSRQMIGQTTALAQRIAAGDADSGMYGEARRLYQRGAYSPEEFESAVKAITNNAESRIGKASDAMAVQELLAAGQKLDPADKAHRDGLSALFDQTANAAGMEKGDDRWRTLALATTQTTNILPEQAESWARVSLLSSLPGEATAAARFMAQVKEANPAAYPWNDEPQLEAFSSLLRQNIDAGIPAQKAYDLAHESVYPKSEGVSKMRSDKYNEFIKKNPNLNVLSGNPIFENGWGPDIAPSDAIQAEYEAQVRQYYIATGDIENARRLATENINANWGETRINGRPEVVKYPIERYGLETPALRQDLAETLKAVGVEADPATVKLIPIPATDRTRGRTWGLVVEDEFGVPDVILDQNNRPLGYTLPVSDDYAARREEINAQLLDKARKDREALLRRDEIVKEIKKFDDEGR